MQLASALRNPRGARRRQQRRRQGDPTSLSSAAATLCPCGIRQSSRDSTMTHYRFVHAADLHLDSPFKGFLRDAAHVAATMRDATFRTFEAIVDLCIEQRVNALLIAGDIYDGADRSLGAQLRFHDGLQRLESANIRVFICHGNHDPLDGWEARIDFPSNVVRFGPEVTNEPFDPDDPLSPMVYGISYPTRDVYQNLVPLFPVPVDGRYAIGLLHANVGTNTGHEAYAPCSLEDLATSDYDYWALGHVHTRAVLRDRAPVVVYPGNPQGRHINEAGERGVYLVDLDERGGATLEFVVVDVVRWIEVAIDVTDLEGEQELLSTLNTAIDDARVDATGRPLIYRLRFRGRGAIHQTLARAGFTDDVRKVLNSRLADGSAFAFCERVEDESAPATDREALLLASDVLGDALRWGEKTASGGPDALDPLKAELRPLYAHPRLRRYLGDGALDALDFQSLLAGAERYLIDDLLDTEQG